VKSWFISQQRRVEISKQTISYDAAECAAKASSRMLKKCSVATRYVLRFGRWRFQESLLEGPEDEQADQYNNAENQCEDRHLLDS
jgi:hypothetical protein